MQLPRLSLDRQVRSKSRVVDACSRSRALGSRALGSRALEVEVESKAWTVKVKRSGASARKTRYNGRRLRFARGSVWTVDCKFAILDPYSRELRVVRLFFVRVPRLAFVHAVGLPAKWRNGADGEMVFSSLDGEGAVDPKTRRPQARTAGRQSVDSSIKATNAAFGTLTRTDWIGPD